MHGYTVSEKEKDRDVRGKVPPCLYYLKQESLHRVKSAQTSAPKTAPKTALA
jgi:hypothetical protein